MGWGGFTQQMINSFKENQALKKRKWEIYREMRKAYVSNPYKGEKFAYRKGKLMSKSVKKAIIEASVKERRRQRVFSIIALIISICITGFIFFLFTKK